ncbi:hypothetical protein ACWF7H_24495 [Peribacillus butanolivorans]|uniref:hypothetical protein n=1 Tax=Peribacillus butanolivorans TaxID=421767 RepID=UPI0036CE61B4
MKRKISLDILAGGNDLDLTGKKIPAEICSAVMMEPDKRWRGSHSYSLLIKG